MVSSKHNKEVRKQLSQLVGDPHDMEIVYPEGTRPNHPYTRQQGSGDPADQFSELATCRIDGQLMRLIEEQVQLSYPYYRTKSDWMRDAMFKWAKYLHGEYFAPDSGGQEPVVKQLDVISRQAWETQQRREFAELMQTLNDNLWDLVREGQDAREKLAEEMASYAERIQDIDDAYWRARTIREFVEIPCFRQVLQALKDDVRYARTPLTQLLSTWAAQRYVLKDATAV